MADFSFLRELWIDPENVAQMQVAAERGNSDAQYAMGLIFMEGRGVERDDVRAYYWLSRAIEQGNADARTLIQIVAFNMTEAKFEQAGLLLDGYQGAESPAKCAPVIKRNDHANWRRLN